MGRRKGQIAAMASSQLVKDRHRRPGRRDGSDSFLHTSELNDGADYNRINFQSVTEQNNLEEFLTTAEMADRDFTAERQNIQVISNPGQGTRMTEQDLMKITEAQDTHKSLLQIPRRPEWDETTTKEELNLSERDSFTNWRRQLKLLEEKEHIQMTPYEKNLDFWRQLWRVIERSDVIVQIVDARNPLLFRCEDLELYVKEVDATKTCMLLINKADYLNHRQRQQWVDFFNKEGIIVVFFSAMQEKEKQEGTAESVSREGVTDKQEDYYDTEEEYSQESEEEEDEENNDDSDTENNPKEELKSEEEKDTVEDLEKDVREVALEEKENSEKPVVPTSVSPNSCYDTQSEGNPSHTENGINNNPAIVSAEELLDIFRKLAQPASQKGDREVQTIGMVGYPNVGKSSTINVILEEKKLAVSATPGRTKHLQTLHVDRHLVLCDCPGLVFPSFVATKAHLVINGILPIDELRDHVQPVTLVCEYIPRDVLGATYSIMIPRPSADDDDGSRPPTAEEFLTAYGAMRGFMTPRGVPDCPRASRYILKDFVKGKLLYCNPPPGLSGPEFQDKDRQETLINSRPISKMPVPVIASDIDKEFFRKKQVKAHSRGITGVQDFVRADTLQHASRSSDSIGGSSMAGSMTSLASSAIGSKPWKKHNNRNKKEKLRRLHRDLDV